MPEEPTDPVISIANDISSLVEDNQLLAALDKLASIASLRKQAVLLRRSLRQVEYDFNSGVLGRDDRNTEHNKIAERILSLASSEAQTVLHIESSEDAVYIVQLIGNPNQEGSPSITTVWMAATGGRTYIFDSVTITHHPGPSPSTFSGALAPDAEYRFTYSYGSANTYPLSPALRLSPDDQREISFTLGLAPTGHFPSVSGHVACFIHYHSSDGSKGSLVLEEPSANGVLLSRLLRKDVRVLTQRSNIQVISPFGIQKGADAAGIGTPGIVEYMPLHIPFIPFYELDNISQLDAFLREEGFPVEFLRSRELLNREITSQHKVAEVIAELSTGNPIFFDICAGLMDDQCQAALVGISQNDKLFDTAVVALAKRHLIDPSSFLADFLLQQRQRPNWYVPMDEVIAALTLRPVGDWFELLFILAQRNSEEALRSVYLHHEKLTEEQVTEVTHLCWEILEKGWPLYPTLIKFLLLDRSPEEIKDDILNLPVHQDQDIQRYVKQRRLDLIEEVLGSSNLMQVEN